MICELNNLLRWRLCWLKMLDTDNISNSHDLKLIQYLKVSADELDCVIHEIVDKTAKINTMPSSNWVI